MKHITKIILITCLFTFLFTHIEKVYAADNMCNVNPGSCTTDQQWIDGWVAAREPENQNATPQQDEWTNANDPGPPEIIREAGESGDINRSQKAADAGHAPPVNTSVSPAEDTYRISNNQPLRENNPGNPRQKYDNGGLFLDNGDFGKPGGVWGKFGVDCNRNSATCTGSTVRVYSCNSSEIQKGSGGGPICLRGLKETSGSVNCVEEANKTCSFVQLDVVTNDPLSGSAITCYPTNCSSPAPQVQERQQLPPPITNPPPVDSPESSAETTQQISVQTPTPTLPPGISAQCVNIKIYDANWVQIAAADLPKLTAGQLVRLSVTGNTSSGTITSARFTVNGTQRPAVSTKNPSNNNEFYDEYTIPTGVTNFSIKAEVNHSSLGWF